MPQANSTTSRPRATSPAASEATLPCSARDQRGQLGLALADQLAEGEHDAGPLDQRGLPPAGERRFRRGPTAASTSAAVA